MIVLKAFVDCKIILDFFYAKLGFRKDLIFD